MLERASALGEAPGDDQETGDLPEVQGTVDASVPFKVGKAALIEEYERKYVTELMKAHGGNITQAARAADIVRVYLLRLLDRYGLRPSKKPRR